MADLTPPVALAAFAAASIAKASRDARSAGRRRRSRSPGFVIPFMAVYDAGADAAGRHLARHRSTSSSRRWSRSSCGVPPRSATCGRPLGLAGAAARGRRRLRSLVVALPLTDEVGFALARPVRRLALWRARAARGLGRLSMPLAPRLGRRTSPALRGGFTLAWTHSIEKIRWEEDYACRRRPARARRGADQGQRRRHGARVPTPCSRAAGTGLTRASPSPSSTSHAPARCRTGASATWPVAARSAASRAKAPSRSSGPAGNPMPAATRARGRSRRRRRERPLRPVGAAEQRRGDRAPLLLEIALLRAAGWPCGTSSPHCRHRPRRDAGRRGPSCCADRPRPPGRWRGHDPTDPSLHAERRHGRLQVGRWLAGRERGLERVDVHASDHAPEGAARETRLPARSSGRQECTGLGTTPHGPFQRLVIDDRLMGTRADPPMSARPALCHEARATRARSATALPLAGRLRGSRSARHQCRERR